MGILRLSVTTTSAIAVVKTFGTHARRVVAPGPRRTRMTRNACGRARITLSAGNLPIGRRLRSFRCLNTLAGDCTEAENDRSETALDLVEPPGLPPTCLSDVGDLNLAADSSVDVPKLT